MPRLFTGLEIPNDISFALSLKRGGILGARWIEPANYHITLRYIGDVDGRTANDIADILGLMSHQSEIAIKLIGLGVFGGNKPRALYADIAPDPSLLGLQAAQERALQQIGLPPEGRKFTPHITLARFHRYAQVSAFDIAQFMSEAAAFTPLSFTAPRFVLYSARNLIGGGPYVVEEVYDLAR